MSKHNKIYKVVAYIGDLHSRTTLVLYETTKMSKAESYLYDYLDSNPNCCKAFIESSYVDNFDKRRYIDED